MAHRPPPARFGRLLPPDADMLARLAPAAVANARKEGEKLQAMAPVVSQSQEDEVEGSGAPAAT